MRRSRLLLVAFAVVLVLAGLYAQVPVGGALPTTETADRLVVDKTARTLTLFSGDRVLKTYRVRLGRNPVGPKAREGDGRTPEGAYVIDRRNPRDESPSLRSRVAGELRRNYANAVKRAVPETGGLRKEDFPVECPFTIDEILDDAFLPS